ncbi:restriction endonuclease subunit S [Methylomicrobium lacus]|uniref:restriction endonuclease subunit S n=1 Tax=Methylomicrobium lacus TaxID=136992 RepID=UPI00045E901B|nr:restriction endonuclease subunit S [Methylomicrobium lacus]
MSNSHAFIKFGEIADFRNGLNFDKESHGKGCLLIGVADFQKHFTPSYESLEEINPDGVSREEDYIKKNDLIFVRSNGNKSLVGRSLFIDRDIRALYSGFCIRARLKNDVINPLFLAYYTKTNHFKASISYAAGTNINNLSQGILSEVNVPHYSKESQLAITNVLSAIDQKIELNNRINAELEAMAKTLYDYWFVQFDFPFDFAQGKPAANGKPYKSSGGKMVYNPILKREIPVGWNATSLWDIAKYYNGLAMQKHRPTNDKFLPVIKIREMNDGFSDSTEKASINIPKEAVVNDGDVLFSWSATLDVKIWSQGPGALNQHIFKVTSDKYPKSFYYFELLNYLNHFKMMAELRKTTMGHITLDHLKQAKISLPSLELLEQAAQFIEPIFNKHLMLEKENRTLSTIRDWLLPMLMNGQITVQSATTD